MIISIRDNKFKIKTMITQKQIQKGMMGTKFDSGFNGMLFLMDGDDHCFWMKNCIIPLDIIFIKDFEINEIHHNCPPCKEEDCDRYCGNGDFILEIKGGSCKKLNIKVGDVIDIH